MRTPFVLIVLLLSSCDNELPNRLEITKEEAIRDYIYPIGLKIRYPDNVVQLIGEEPTRNVWVALQGENFDLVIAARSHYEDFRPEEHFDTESKALIERYPSAEFLDSSTHKFKNIEIEFVHYHAQDCWEGSLCNTLSFGVLKHQKHWLQIRINEHLKSPSTTSKFLSDQTSKIHLLGLWHTDHTKETIG